jgi:RND family efflux transporter MFP subunit
MNTKQNIHESPPQQTPGSGYIKRAVRFVLSLTIPVCITAFALGVYVYQIKNRPKAERRKPPRQARLVNVETIHKTTCPISVSAMGLVVPAREITITPEVTGVITSIDPVVLPGGIIQKGQILFEIDSRDYHAIVKQRQSDVEKAELNLKLESGNQTIAQQEYKMLEEIIEEQDKELVLRMPHLEETQAALEAAKAMLDKARLDVQRCTIKAPFNAIIKNKYTDLGARVSASNPLVSLIGIDEYWLEAVVSVDQLQWIDIPKDNGQKGSAAKIYNISVWGDSQYREGQVIRLLGQLEIKGRMAKLLIAIQDPLCLRRNDMNLPLLIDSYVQAEIQGRQLTDVFPIQREYIRNGNQVWIMNENNKLEIRPVEIVFGSKDTVYIRNGFQEGDKVVTTDLSTPVEGMPLRTDHETPETDIDFSITKGEPE